MCAVSEISDEKWSILMIVSTCESFIVHSMQQHKCSIDCFWSESKKRGKLKFIDNSIFAADKQKVRQDLPEMQTTFIRQRATRCANKGARFGAFALKLIIHFSRSVLLLIYFDFCLFFHFGWSECAHCNIQTELLKSAKKIPWLMASRDDSKMPCPSKASVLLYCQQIKYCRLISKLWWRKRDTFLNK